MIDTNFLQAVYFFEDIIWTADQIELNCSQDLLLGVPHGKAMPDNFALQISSFGLFLRMCDKYRQVRCNQDRSRISPSLDCFLSQLCNIIPQFIKRLPTRDPTLPELDGPIDRIMMMSPVSDRERFLYGFGIEIQVTSPEVFPLKGDIILCE